MPKQIFKIVLTGGGTAGHVLPHWALVPHYKEAGWTPLYIGGSGIEQELVAQQSLPFHRISVGKLRRHMSLQNFLDVFKVLIGTFQSLLILMKERPQLVFSKGGYVSVPVCIAAWMLRIPVVTHESDLTPGLANKILARFSRKILYTFPSTKSLLPTAKSECVGLPVRPELSAGDAQRGYALTGFHKEKPVLLIMGGSQGAARINTCVEQAFPTLTEKFQLIHITGKGKQTFLHSENYFQREYVHEELKDLLAITDLVLCRAGANSLFEMLTLRIPMLLIPLEQGSRGDQIQNAEAFQTQGWAHVIREAELSQQSLLQSLEQMLRDTPRMKEAMKAFPVQNSALSIFRILQSVV